ncbi:alanine racemase [Aquamicrobium sp. LC103]|uniref:alanine racemase n=1 Tax=Aquamicrobium sp. LC103 TaxID=1120658 RepID=UPI00069C8180|nr:alanine racemase [Aquamicrobium sp. LC103]
MPFSPDSAHQGADPRLAGGRLTIDLGALAENYRMLAQRAAPARVAGVVKANAYGLGIAMVVPTLWQAGCRTFFVALPEEGIAARRAAPGADIFVLNGLFGPESAPAYAQHRLMPVLNTQADISAWEAFGWDGKAPRPCAIHVDSGMNRLGVTAEELHAFAHENSLTQAVTPLLLMSHLACADDAASPMNARQLESFQKVRRILADSDSSLSNSAGIFLGPDYHFDLVRPGIALYGGAPYNGGRNPMKPVVTAEARIVQVRHARAGETASYGASAALARDTVIAVASVGYADGYPRSASGAGVPLRYAVTNGAHGFLHGKRVPLLGRVTMDLTLFDVTGLGDAANVGDHIELFGPNIPIDEAATAAGTISYELLTSLGKRYYRHYVAADQPQ